MAGLHLALAGILLLTGGNQSLADLTVDAQPAIRAFVVPPPNAAGWNNTDVTIAFQCTGAVTCPDEVVLSSEGPAQRVTRTVVDAQGRAASVEVAVSIDKSPATVRIDRREFPNADTVKIIAYASDSQSGVAAAFCNGVPATSHLPEVQCALPYEQGFTDVAVTVLDRAGNSASDAMQLARDATSDVLKLFPAKATLRVGESRIVTLRDSAWHAVVADLWSAMDPTIASVDATGTVTALRIGETTITGGAPDGRTAVMTVVVIGEGAYPNGTEIWRGHPAQENAARYSIPVPPDRQSLMFAESTDDGRLWISAISISGDALWFTRVASNKRERLATRMTDHAGSPLLWLNGEGRSAIIRTGRPSDGRIWRYELDTDATGNWALGPDGTLWIVETPRHGYPQVSAIDYLTGELKFRTAMTATLMPLTVATTLQPTQTLEMRPASVGPPTVFADGDVAIPMALTSIRRVSVDGGDRHFAAEREVGLLHISPEGSERFENFLWFHAAELAALPVLRLVDARPDCHGGALILMRVTVPDGRWYAQVMRKLGEDVKGYRLPTVGRYVCGTDQAFTSDGKMIVAFDPVSGKVNWTRTSEEPIALEFALDDGGAVVSTKTGTQYKYSRDGTVSPFRPMPDRP